MKFIKITALLASFAVASSAFGCSSKSSSSSEKTAETPTTSAQTTAAAEDKTEAPSEKETEASKENETSASTENTEPNSDESPGQDGFTDSLSIARAYYQAYIDHDAEAVYAMFNKDEIEGYCKLMADMLDEKSPEEVFRKAVIIRSIEGSMDNIKSIMDGYAVSANDKWTVELTANDLTPPSKEDFDKFNESLGLSYSSAVECRFVFYKNEKSGDSFTGNSSAFLEKDGKWYLSFSNAMGTDLLNYIELD